MSVMPNCPSVHLSVAQLNIFHMPHIAVTPLSCPVMSSCDSHTIFMTPKMTDLFLIARDIAISEKWIKVVIVYDATLGKYSLDLN